MPGGDGVGGGRSATGTGSSGGLKRVTRARALFSDLAGPDRDAIARLFTPRVFAPGETVTKEGSDAAAFYLIESGTATVTVHGAFRRTLHPGDHFESASSMGVPDQPR